MYGYDISDHDKNLKETYCLEQAGLTFEEIKNYLTEDSCISYFDNKKETSILLQNTPGKNDLKVVVYSSCALSETEQRYSQIERECLSIMYACERNGLYLLGRIFIIYNDHKALVHLLNNPNATIPLRIERMVLRMQGYNFQLKHVKTDENISDYMSRHPFDKAKIIDINETYINWITKLAVLYAIKLTDIENETAADTTLKHLKNLIRGNSWFKLDEPGKHEELINVDINTLKKYRKVKHELTVTTQNVILKGNKIIIPTKYHQIVIQLVHKGHQGLNKTKALLRMKIFFFGMDALVEKLISGCLACQVNSNDKIMEPIICTDIPEEVWHTIHVDYLGPLPNGSYIFVFMDQTSKYPEIGFLSNTSAHSLIPLLDHAFSTFGLPKVVVSDNGPPFNSHMITNYFKQMGIKHRKMAYRQMARWKDL